METRILGRTQLRVGEIGLGVEHLNVSLDNMDAVFDLAVASGLNYVDVLYNDPDAESAEHWKAIGPALRRYRDSLVLASRMESSGSPDEVNISANTYSLVKDQFECISRGKIKAKNKGEIEMFFVKTRKEILN